MKTAKQHNIIYNRSPCQIRQPQITFYGAVFTAKGMWPDPSQIQGLQDLPTNNSPVKLQSFLGLINYLKPFIPGLSNKTMFALLQSGQPIAFTSETLTDVKTHYMNIEKMCLSVCFGLEKFYTYLYSRHVIIQNDHKPLEMIQQKSLHATPSHLQHMLLWHAKV